MEDKIVKVYRVENSQGVGAFNAAYVTFYYNSFNDNCALNCPLPENDSSALSDLFSNYDRSQYYFFGFENLHHLQLVFPNMAGRKIASEETDVQISIYEVERQYVVFGKRQLVFKREHAKIVDKLSFFTLTPI